MELIKKHRQELDEACLTFQVGSLYVPGSILTEKFNAKSDIAFTASLTSKAPVSNMPKIILASDPGWKASPKGR